MSISAQPQFSKLPQAKRQTQPWFSENSQPVHHYSRHLEVLSVLIDLRVSVALLLLVREIGVSPVNLEFHRKDWCSFCLNFHWIQFGGIVQKFSVIKYLRLDRLFFFSFCSWLCRVRSRTDFCIRGFIPALRRYGQSFTEISIIAQTQKYLQR